MTGLTFGQRLWQRVNDPQGVKVQAEPHFINRSWTSRYSKVRAALLSYGAGVEIEPESDITVVAWCQEGKGGEIFLSIQPWVSAEKVREVYTETQKKIAGGRQRSLGEENLGKIDFVLEKLREEGFTATWRSLAEEYNKRFPESVITDRGLCRDVIRSGWKLLFPLSRHRINERVVESVDTRP